MEKFLENIYNFQNQLKKKWKSRIACTLLRESEPLVKKSTHRKKRNGYMVLHATSTKPSEN